MALINCPECNKQISDKAVICVGCGAPVEVEEQFSIVGTPVKFCNLEIAENNFPKLMNWDEANEACKSLGEGWRLPSKDELVILGNKDNYLNGRLIYHLVSDNFYWSSTEKDINFAWYIFFSNCSVGNANKNHNGYARAVRSF